MKTSLTQCAAATLAVVAALALSACDKREGAAGPGAGTGSSSSSGSGGTVGRHRLDGWSRRFHGQHGHPHPLAFTFDYSGAVPFTPPPSTRCCIAGGGPAGMMLGFSWRAPVSRSSYSRSTLISCATFAGIPYIPPRCS